MRTVSAVIGRFPGTGLLVGYVTGFPGAHSQQLIVMLLADCELQLNSSFVGLQQICLPA